MSQTTLAPKSPLGPPAAPVTAPEPAKTSGSRWWHVWRDLTTDLLFPPQCTNCSLELTQSPKGPLLCCECIQRLFPVIARCPACAAPAGLLATHDGRCPSCRAQSPAFAAARVLGSYDGLVRQSVLKIKHSCHEPLATALGKLLARRIVEMPLPATVDLIVPVPMYWLRRLVRRTNAAQTLAETLSGELGIGLADDLVRCRRMTARQSSLPASERRENVRGAYRASSAYDIRGATILVVDDVITTAATCDEVARVLKRAGAQRVFAAAVARAGGSI